MKLKIIRIFFAAIIFLLIFFTFYLNNEVLLLIGNFFTSFQFSASFLRIGGPGFLLFNLTGLILIIGLTLCLGRVYCSFLCPLGCFMDTVIFSSRKIKRKKFRYFKLLKSVKYLFFAFLIIGYLIGHGVLLSFIDPYSIFGKIVLDLVRPVTGFVNNLVSSILINSRIYLVSPVNIPRTGLLFLFLPLAYLLVIIALAWFKGRFYCNQICPVGTMLGFFAKKSFFRVVIDKKNCTGCGNCENICKAGCIDAKKRQVDNDQCIACFNCLDICHFQAISYRPLTQIHQTDRQKRSFLIFSKELILGALTLSILPLKDLFRKKGLIKPMLKRIIPPGALNNRYFTANCIGCHLCISKCPTGVLKTSFQPELDFSRAFCEFECNLCSQVCPTNAITPLSLENKKRVQIGKAEFYKERCIVFTDNTFCGACSEHCPTKAVYMVDYINHLTIPEMNAHLCIGCGACEHMCPVKPERAIIVKPNDVHSLAAKPIIEPADVKDKESEQSPAEPEDFPF